MEETVKGTGVWYFMSGFLHESLEGPYTFLKCFQTHFQFRENIHENSCNLRVRYPEVNKYR